MSNSMPEGKINEEIEPRHKGAIYRYKTGVVNGTKMLLIVDDGNGRAMTVTNDIENVVAEIAQKDGIDPKERQNSGLFLLPAKGPPT